jgi:phosphonate transport system ATP-binding protein
MHTTTPPIFELDHVTVTFGNFSALTNISFQVAAGERVAVVGSSGAGKSTLLSLLNGSILPTTGNVQAFGDSLPRLSLRQLRQVQRRIGTIYQQFNLVDNLRVIHNVNAGHLGRWSFPKALWSLIRPLEVHTAYEALTQVGIPEKLYARLDQLSGGQQQRVALARVLVQQPTVILADEPVSSLDPKRSVEIMDLLRDLTTAKGTTLICSLHSVEFVRTHFSRVIGLQAGRIMFDTPSKTFTPEVMHALYA